MVKYCLLSRKITFDFYVCTLGGIHQCEMDKCEPNYNTQYWSMKKLGWVTFKNQPKLPTNFSMISGCGLSFRKQKVLLIGGHRIKKSAYDWLDDYVEKFLRNDQVLMYDFVHQTWTWLTNIPLGSLWPSELKCSVIFTKSLRM